MKNFVIITDSSCNLNSAALEKYNIQCLPMHFYIGDKAYDSSGDWKDISAKEFYDIIRSGQRITSSQVTSVQYRDAFEKAVKNGFDVLSISCAGALSSSVHESYAACKKVLATHPEANIVCIDSANACFALGMLAIEAAKLRDTGKTLKEVADWVENNKTKFNEAGTVDKLIYLKQAGRVSATAAFFGGILGVKPIIISDDVGHNIAVEKVKGKTKSYERVADYIEKYALPEENNSVYIAHGDCLEDAMTLGTMITERFPSVKLEITYGYIEPGVGSACGPDTIIVDFFGKAEMRVKSN